MAIKEIYIRGSGGDNIMPSITQGGVSGSNFPSTPPVQTLQQWLDDFAKRRGAMKEYKQALADLVEEDEIKVSPSVSVVKGGAKERYLVNQETGVITVDEENGEHNYRDAQLVSASIRASRGEYDQAIALIKALKGDQSAMAETKKKEFYVEEDGEIVHDPENGDLTLSEARAVSWSRRALIPQDETLTKDKLEIFRRDMKDEMKGVVSEEVGKIKTQGAREIELPFTLDDKGEVQINKNARLGLMELIVFNSLKGAQRQDRLFKDKDGMIMDLPSWLEVKKFEGEEKRKDDMQEAVTGLMEMGKKELPGLIQGIQNMTTSKKAEEALEKGGWRGREDTKGEVKSEVKTAECAGCGTKIPVTTSPSIQTCPKCRSLNFIGTPDELNLIKTQLSASAGEGEGKQE